jgi:hypothetical protein
MGDKMGNTTDNKGCAMRVGGCGNRTATTLMSRGMALFISIGGGGGWAIRVARWEGGGGTKPQR